MRPILIAILSLIALFATLGFLVVRSLGHPSYEGAELFEVPNFEEDDRIPIPGRVRLLVAAADYGLGPDGISSRRQPFNEVDDRVDEIANAIAINTPDIVVLFESVESGAKVYDLSLGRRVAAETGLTQLAYLPTWERPDAWWPLWPIGTHAGRIDAGVVVISRYPIEPVQSERLAVEDAGFVDRTWGPEGVHADLIVTLPDGGRVHLHLQDLQHGLPHPVPEAPADTVGSLVVRHSTLDLGSLNPTGLNTDDGLLYVGTNDTVEVLRSSVTDRYDGAIDSPVIAAELQLVERVPIQAGALRAGPGLEVMIDEHGEVTYVTPEPVEGSGAAPDLRRIEDLIAEEAPQGTP